MAKTKQQKQELVKQLSDKIKNAKLAVIADLHGLTVEQSQTLRSKCKEQGVEVISAKKTLLGLALKENKIEGIDTREFEGSLGLAVSEQDEVIPAKLVKEFAKDNESVEFRVGVLEGKIIDVDTLKQLADLPSKEELYAKVVGSLNAPISGFVNVLAGNIRGLVNVLNAIKDNK